MFSFSFQTVGPEPVTNPPYVKHVKLGGKYDVRHEKTVASHVLPLYYPVQVIDGPYDSFEGRDCITGEEDHVEKWVVRYNDGNVALLDGGHFLRHLYEVGTVGKV